VVLDGEMDMDENIAVHGRARPLKIRKIILGPGKGEGQLFVSSFLF
jgi:hypothetical protein